MAEEASIKVRNKVHALFVQFRKDTENMTESEKMAIIGCMYSLNMLCFIDSVPNSDNIISRVSLGGDVLTTATELVTEQLAALISIRNRYTLEETLEVAYKGGINESKN
jgi:hypothetical protein